MSASFPKFFRAVGWVTKEGAGIRTWLAVLGVPVALGSYWWSSHKTNTALGKIGAVQDDIQKVQKDIAKYTSVSGQATIEKQLPKLGRVHRCMSEDMFWLPDDPKQRSRIVRYMDWATVLAHGKALYEAPALVERHGFRIERLLANPYVQDKMLANSARFKSVVDLGKEVLAQPPPSGAQPYQDTAFCREAQAFVAAFDKEAAACHAAFETARQTRELCTTAECVQKVNDERRIATGAGGEDGCYLYCEYTKQRFRKHRQSTLQ